MGGEKKLRRSESERFTSNLPQECGEANKLSENSTFLFYKKRLGSRGKYCYKTSSTTRAPNSVLGIVYDMKLVLHSSIFQ